MKDKIENKSIQKFHWGKRKRGQEHGTMPFFTKTKYNR